MFKRLCVFTVLVASGCGGDAEVGPSADAGAQVVDTGSDRPSDGDAGSVPTSATVHGLDGAGLLLRTAAGEVIDVMDDGRIAFSEPLATGAASFLEVVRQPTDPNQTCTVVWAAPSLDVACATDRFQVGGEAQGLAGSGLTLHTSWGEDRAVDATGAFTFAQMVPDGTAFEVMIGAQPTKPRQQCSIEHGSGTVDGASVSDLVVRCTTETFGVSGEVTGLLGSGLELTLAGRQTVSVSGTGTRSFAFDALVPDASSYAVTVSHQPQNPAQRCVVVNGEGAVDGDVAGLRVICGALGGLRISEVGSCYHADAACWVEIYNAGDAMEDLTYYQLRLPGLNRAMLTYAASQQFPLPSLAIPPGGYVVVRGKSSSALPDGAGVVHITADGFIPWWTTSGFAELSTNGVGIDFVRFGASSVEPTAPTTFAGVAPAQASSGQDYGRSIARDLAETDRDGASDWAVRAFATPGGPNDVVSDVDDDGDGIPDASEVSGGRFAGVDVYAMGARKNKRDIFVEIDRMDATDPAVIPRREALDSVVRAFAAHQIVVHYDVGSLFSASFDPAAYNLGGGNVVPFSPGVGIGESGAGLADIYAYKSANMAAARRSFFYYQLFGWSQNADGSGGSSGIGERPGNDSIITLGGFGLKDSSTAQRNLIVNYQAATMMHELGHNLNLLHGGGDSDNRKPNYVSVMNYLYSPIGLPTIAMSEGDRFQFQSHCGVYSLLQLTNSPAGSPSSFVIDFSNGLSADIDENDVDERDGLGRATSEKVDYNCNGYTDSPYARDLNSDSKKSVLADYDDWSNLSFVFRRTYSGNENGPSLLFWVASEPVHEDVLTDDVQPVPADPCPAWDLSRI